MKTTCVPAGSTPDVKTGGNLFACFEQPVERMNGATLEGESMVQADQEILYPAFFQPSTPPSSTLAFVYPVIRYFTA